MEELVTQHSWGWISRPITISFPSYGSELSKSLEIIPMPNHLAKVFACFKKSRSFQNEFALKHSIIYKCLKLIPRYRCFIEDIWEDNIFV
jgi:hypothetical protein